MRTNETAAGERNACCHGGSGKSLLFLFLGLAAGFAGAMYVMKRNGMKRPRQVSIEDLRKAYAGLGPEEE